MRFIVVILLATLLSTLSFTQEKPGYIKRTFNTVVDDLEISFHDVVGYYAKPLHWSSTDWLIAGGSAAATYSLIFADKDLRKFFGRGTTRSINYDFWDYPTYYGVVDYVNYAAFIMYGIGLLTEEDEIRTTSRLVIEALFTSGTSVMILRSIHGRYRPVYTDDPWDFVGFKLVDEYMSFPSGHSTVAFALSTVLAERIDTWWSRTLFYGLGSLASYARLLNNQHWFTDIITGTAFGIGAGLYVVNREKDRENKKEEQSLQIIPSFNGLNFIYKF